MALMLLGKGYTLSGTAVYCLMSMDDLLGHAMRVSRVDNAANYRCYYTL